MESVRWEGTRTREKDPEAGWSRRLGASLVSQLEKERTSGVQGVVGQAEDGVKGMPF